PHDHAADLDLLALEHRQAPAVATVGPWDPVVSDQRVGEGQNLTPERWVGERLRISHHPGGEHDLADATGGCPEPIPFEACPILEKKRPPEAGGSGVIRHGRWQPERPRGSDSTLTLTLAPSSKSRRAGVVHPARHQIPPPVARHDARVPAPKGGPLRPR